MALRGLRAVHGARVRLFHGPLGLGNAAPRGRPLARHVLFARDFTQGDSAVNEGDANGANLTKNELTPFPMSELHHYSASVDGGRRFLPSGSSVGASSDASPSNLRFRSPSNFCFTEVSTG